MTYSVNEFMISIHSIELKSEGWRSWSLRRFVTPEDVSDRPLSTNKCVERHEGEAEVGVGVGGRVGGQSWAGGS